MKRTVTLAVTIGLLLAAAASAQTRNGSASGAKSPTFDLDASGQVVFTLMWPKKTADLDMGVFCPDDMGFPTLVALGISPSDRVERMEMGVGNTENCFVGVAAFKGGSKFTLNVFSSNGLGFARAPAKVLDLDEPGSPERAAAIEQLLAAKRRSLEK